MWDEHENQAGRVDHAEKDEVSTTANAVKSINVMFSSTAYGPLWRPAVDSWLRVVGVTSRELTVSMRGKMGGVGVTDRTYVHSASNQLVKDFLDNEEATHLFCTEMDMILPDDTILKLLALDKDIACGLYFIRNGDGQPCLYQKVFTQPGNPYPHSPVHAFPTSRPFKVDCPGMGCVLFRKSVFETVMKPWFDLKADHYGSDMYFFTKSKEAGVECWCDPTVRCAQVDYCVVSYEDYEKKIAKEPDWLSKGVILGGLE